MKHIRLHVADPATVRCPLAFKSMAILEFETENEALQLFIEPEGLRQLIDAVASAATRMEFSRLTRDA